jgi:hypothetical protein
MGVWGHIRGDLPRQSGSMFVSGCALLQHGLMLPLIRKQVFNRMLNPVKSLLNMLKGFDAEGEDVLKRLANESTGGSIDDASGKNLVSCASLLFAV